MLAVLPGLGGSIYRAENETQQRADKQGSPNQSFVIIVFGSAVDLPTDSDTVDLQMTHCSGGIARALRLPRLLPLLLLHLGDALAFTQASVGLGMASAHSASARAESSAQIGSCFVEGVARTRKLTRTLTRKLTGVQRCEMQDPALLFNFLAGGVAGTVASVTTQVLHVLF